MSKTVAQASADYRKRRADKLARYEAALREIARFKGEAGKIAQAAIA